MTPTAEIEPPAEHFRFVVIGAGPCGGRAALDLAEATGPGKVALVGDEGLPPYERPPLSKSFLKAEASPAPPILFGLDRYAKAGACTILDNPAYAIRAAQREVVLQSGRRLRYDGLLIATGAGARRLTIEGADLPGLLYLRSASDAKALRAELHGAAQIVIIGGGFIGLETAASARALGLEVTVIEAGQRLLGRSVPGLIADAVLRTFRANGVDVALGTSPTRIVGDIAAKGVELDDGRMYRADAVIVGIGCAPNVALGESAGLAVENGIVTDGDGRTSDASIFAAGDVSSRHVAAIRGYRRLEAWEPALERGSAVAAAMLGKPTPPERPPWAWSDQFDMNIQVAGHGDLANREILVGDPTSPSFTVLQCVGDSLVGVAGLNAGREIAFCRRALAVGATVRAGSLSAPLKDMLAIEAPGARDSAGG